MDCNFYEARKFQAILQIPSFSPPWVLASYMVYVYSEFVDQRSSYSKWLKKIHEVTLAMSYIVASWICIFLTSQILPNLLEEMIFSCSFRQPYVHDIEYNRVLQFLQKNQVKRGASMWSSNFLVEVAMKCGVLLAIPRNEARKSPRKPTSCSKLMGAFDTKNNNKNIQNYQKNIIDNQKN